MSSMYYNQSLPTNRPNAVFKSGSATGPKVLQLQGGYTLTGALCTNLPPNVQGTMKLITPSSVLSSTDVPDEGAIQQKITLPDNNKKTCSGEVGWEHNDKLSKGLISLYEKYRPKVGTFAMKNLRKLFETITEKLNEDFQTNYTVAQVQNRWAVLERNYKKTIDNNNKTGRSRKVFMYEKEMDAIFRKKKNFHPELLLNATTQDHDEAKGEEMSTLSDNNSNNLSEGPPTSVIGQTNNHHTLPENKENVHKVNSRKSRKPDKPTRKDVLTLIQEDKKKYHEECLKLKQERRDMDKLKLQIKQENAMQKKRRNDLIEERNTILKGFLEQDAPLPMI